MEKVSYFLPGTSPQRGVSQGSKITSTPRSRVKNTIVSPSQVSEISRSSNTGESVLIMTESSSKSTSMELKQEVLETSSGEELDAQLPSSSGDLAELEDMFQGCDMAGNSDDGTLLYDKSLHIKHSFFKTRLWQMFKPNRTDTIYYQLLTFPNDVEKIINDILDTVQINQISSSIIKLFVDLCGYQKMDLEEDFQSGDCLKYMETHIGTEAVLKRGTYLLEAIEKSWSKDGKIMMAIICSFIHKLMLRLYTLNVRDTKTICDKIFDFVKCMTQSQVTNVRHTGVIVANKILTSLTFIFKCKQDCENVHNDIQLYFKIFKKNCNISDPALKYVKVRNAEELFYYMNNIPTTFMIDLCWKILFNFLVDEFYIVRLLAMETISSLLLRTFNHPYIRKFIPKIVEDVSGRTSDIKKEVAFEAFELLKKLLKSFPSVTENSNYKDVFRWITGTDYAIAKAAADLLVVQESQRSKSEFLTYLIQFSSNSNQKSRPAIVEAFYALNTPLTDLKFVISQILDENTTRLDKNVLLELTYYVVYQTLKGVSLTKRPDSPREEVNKENSDRIVKCFIPWIKDLTELFANSEEGLKFIFQILNLIDYKDVSASYFKSLNTIITCGKNIFLKSTNEDLCKEIIKLLDSWRDTSFCFQESSLMVTSNFYKQMCMSKRGKTDAKELTNMTLNSRFKKLAIILQTNDLSNYFEGPLISSTQLEKSVVGALDCQKHIYEWEIKSLFNSITADNIKENKATVMQLLEKYKSFSSNLLSIIARIEGQERKFCAYENYCDMRSTFTKELEKLSKKDTTFSYEKTLSEEHYILLENFQKEFIIQNKDVPLNTRLRLIAKGVKIVFEGAISMKFLRILFAEYNDSYNDYGCLIEDVIKRLSLYQAMQIILATIIYYYENKFIGKGTPVSEEERDGFRALSKRFIGIKELKNAECKWFEFMHVTTHYCYETKNYEMLYFLRPFCELLNEEDKQLTSKRIRKLFGNITQIFSINALLEKLGPEKKGLKQSKNKKKITTPRKILDKNKRKADLETSSEFDIEVYSTPSKRRTKSSSLLSSSLGSSVSGCVPMSANGSECDDEDFRSILSD